LLECAVKEGRGDMQAFTLDAPELAENEDLIVPRDLSWETFLKDFAGDLH
jgi:hypothetical protein